MSIHEDTTHMPDMPVIRHLKCPHRNYKKIRGALRIRS